MRRGRRRTAESTHDEIQPPDPLPKRSAADLARPYPAQVSARPSTRNRALTGNVDHIEAPLDDSGPAQVLASGDECARRRVAPRRADALKVAREEDRGPEREDVDPEGELRRRERAAAEEQAEEDRERARDEQPEPEVLYGLRVLLR